MNEEGYIKFNCNWIKSASLPASQISGLNKWRSKLYSLGLVGMYKSGIGFGNISIRSGNSFIITGSATGGIKELTGKHYTVVVGYDFANNTLSCKGPVMASSESLTHAAIYESAPEVNAVVHVHNLKLWKMLLNKVPTTSKDVSYGTPDMAGEIIRLFKETDVKQRKILVMAGHKAGVISFGKNLDEAGAALLKESEKCK